MIKNEGVQIPLQQIANMAAAATLKKLRQTGTASPEEILALNAAI